MNVVVLSDHDVQGGAAVATCRIEASIDRAYYHYYPIERWLGDTQRITFFPDGRLPPLATLWYEESTAKCQFLRLPRKLLSAFFPRPNTPEFAADRLRVLLQKLRPDIINVHNLHTATPWGWGPHLIEVCLELAPVVWTLHDMWSFTGRCAYSYDCEKFITGCDAACPTPQEEPRLDPHLIRAAWEQRRDIYTRHRDAIVVVTPSRWLAEQARRGLFAQHRIEVIPYGIETYWNLDDILFFSRLRAHFGQRIKGRWPPSEIATIKEPTNDDLFKVLPRDDARRQLGINAAGPVLLLAAFELTERRKGADILPLLWQHIDHRPLTILTMGHGNIVIDDPLIEVHPLGWIDDDMKKALAYSAADALLHPAPVDNFPNTVLEAMACGTPTIAMSVGGLPEMVRPGVSGWLADTATPAGLGRAVDRAIRDLSFDKNLRESCRTLVEKEYSLDLQGRRYFQLFQELRRR